MIGMPLIFGYTDILYSITIASWLSGQFDSMLGCRLSDRRQTVLINCYEITYRATSYLCEIPVPVPS